MNETPLKVIMIGASMFALATCTSTNLNPDPFLPANVQSTFSVSSGISCSDSISLEHQVIINTNTEQNQRLIYSNAIPDHRVGAFPNWGNPNRIRSQKKSWAVPLQPKSAPRVTSVYENLLGYGLPAYQFGVAINGIKMDPSAMEFFQSPRTGQRNFEWSKEALSTNVNLGDDCSNAHVQPNGEYHYHGTPWGIVEKADGQSMFLTGWAADGFPIYYKWGHEVADDPDSDMAILRPSYQLRKGIRPGDGNKAPDGYYDGTYVRDFEYIAGLGDLDECNGRFGVTPEFPMGTYYYIITDEFPSIPRCFKGNPSKDFKLGRRGGLGPPAPSRRRPPPTELIRMMDRNGDQQISQSEARGPLRARFSDHDKNKDGQLDLSEIEQGRPPSN